MKPRTVLFAVLAATLLFVGGTGAVAGDGTISPDNGSDAADVEDDAELPDDLPEAVGHALLVIGQLLEVVPSVLGDAVVEIV